MELNASTVKQMSTMDIYDLLSPIIKNLYNFFSFVKIDEKEFYKEVLNEIELSQNTYDDETSYRTFMKKRIKSILTKKVKALLANQDTSYELINNYINQRYKNINTVSDSISSFRKINSFLESYSFTLSPNLLIELINKNSVFLNMIELIFNEYKSEIVEGKIEKVFKNGTLLSAIETYCMVFAIEIKETIEEEKITSSGILSDSVGEYLREIGKYKLLSIEEERELSKRVAQGDKEAKEKFINSNLKLVVSIAKRYIGRGLSYLDLIQEGNLGLITAVEKYNPEYGYKFSTYATSWIRQAITRAISNKARTIRIPVHLQDKLIVFQTVYRRLSQKLNREPDVNELANELNITIPEVVKFLGLKNNVFSMNSLVSDGSDTEFEYFMCDTTSTPEEIVVEETVKPQVKELLEKCNLSPKEIKVLLLRNGFNNKEPMTLEKVGQLMNVTRERVRQIEARALKRIRRSSYVKDLAVYRPDPEKAIENIDKYREKYLSTRNPYKAFLNDGKKIEKKENCEDMSRKVKTIYQYFDDYTREQIDDVISKLNDADKEIFTKRFGDDLDNPVGGQMTKEESNKYYVLVVPKMKRMLERSVGKSSMIKINNNNAPSVPKEKTTPVILQKPEPVVKNESGNKDMTRDDCMRMLELLKTPTFSQMMNVLSVKESVILSLKLGYVDGKYFSSESIANFLGIEESEVIETTKKVLLLYKENINSFIDGIIDVVTDKEGKGK